MRHILLSIPIFLALYSGCTPIGEGVVRKVNVVPAQPSSDAGADDEQYDQLLPVLDRPTRQIIEKYGLTIKECSREYGLDWRLVLAMMKQESRFSSMARSKKGARGLMQIMPITGMELARALSLNDLKRPRNNIRGGIFYLSRLYDLFCGAQQADRIKLALAAYNAGIGRIYDAQDVATYLKDNPSSWQAVRDALPLLSRRYYTLHRDVWERDKPASGWFGNAGETIAYVDSIMDYYDEYRLLLD
jgi:membrane-bound lytic murein transglycosylase F